MLQRENYLARIRPYYDSELIKVITGVRRCGKSTIVRQIMEELSRANDKEQIVYYDFEDFDNEAFLDDPQLFYERLKERTSQGKRTYIFLDEVQYLRDFEKVIASARANLNCSLFVTGSTSRLLAGELASRLSGRTIEFQIRPFSFQEALQYTGRDARDLLEDYLEYGGFPFRFNEEVDSRRFATDLYQSIIRRDIIKRHRVADTQTFRNFASFVLSRSGETISTASISGYARSIGNPVSVPTCNQYLDYLEEAFLVTRCNRFDTKGKNILETLSKFYAADPAFVTVQTGKADTNKGFMLETIVHNELLARGYAVYAGKTYKGEIDFVVQSPAGETAYVQVCYLLSDQKVIEREFSAFSSIRDNYPRYVISLDEMDFSQRGIRHMNILDFLEGRKDLF